MRTPSCIRCDKVMVNVFPEFAEPYNNQPADGLEFISYGHYGSTVFDPMNGKYLAINICDDCLRQAGNTQNVLTSFRSTSRDYETWKPHK